MINTGKCPVCKQTLTWVQIEPIEIKEGFQSRWHGVAYSCPSCHSILSVQMDPVALKTDTVTEVAAKVKGR